jgi:hypothetical protein
MRTNQTQKLKEYKLDRQENEDDGDKLKNYKIINSALFSSEAEIDSDSKSFYDFFIK